MWRSVGAVAAGVATVVVLSTATDALMHGLGVFPPWTEPMNDAGDNLLALGYRSAIAVGASFLKARLAPRKPMAHVWVFGAIGLLASLGGIVAALNANLGPIWYPVALAATTLPCAWLGGWLATRGRTPDIDQAAAITNEGSAG